MSFQKETFNFLRDLKKNNTKEWFEENRVRYEAHWKTAALDFIADVSGPMNALSPSLQAEPKINGSLRRINRDVRFSKDKSPYNPSLHMIFWTGQHPNRSPALHIVLQPEGIGYGAGLFGIDGPDLAKYRQRIVDPSDGKALISALNKAKTVECGFGKPELARIPKGFSAEGLRGDLLRHKSYVARTHDYLEKPEVIIGPKADEWVSTISLALMPLIRWLDT